MIIFYLSTGNVSVPTKMQWLSVDKIGHLTFYALEVLLLIGGFAKARQWQTTNWTIIMFCAIVAMSYGTALEFVQGRLPHRSFDYADMVANFVGVCLGLLFYYVMAARFFFKK